VIAVKSIDLFVLAALLEIGGAWLVWQGVREHRGWLWAGADVVALGAYGFVAAFHGRLTDPGNGGRRIPARPLGRRRSSCESDRRCPADVRSALMRIIVTGGNSGVGKATAAALAGDGHSVILACRSVEKANRAAADISGDVEVAELDLADLASVRAFADSVKTVDVLVNNAGVMNLPLTRTADGFEAHMGTNHLGHFALTCLLADKITDRVVSVASAMYHFGRIHFDDLNWHRRKYSRTAAYSESKLANLLFIHELAARGVRAYASDPGMTDSGITRRAADGLPLGEHNPVWRMMHTSAQGSRATLQAVTTQLPSGTYFAPRFNQWGKPRVTGLRKKARDPVAARRLWELSAELTGCDWSS
jgi:NAD(P)-dependent dehydrogenase (short-subunit alcohol dehydrogenase family)